MSEQIQGFLIEIEQGKRNYSAYVSNLPGCVATGETLEEVRANMEVAIDMHIQAILEDGEQVPHSDK